MRIENKDYFYFVYVRNKRFLVNKRKLLGYIYIFTVFAFFIIIGYYVKNYIPLNKDNLIEKCIDSKHYNNEQCEVTRK